MIKRNLEDKIELVKNHRRITLIDNKYYVEINYSISENLCYMDPILEIEREEDLNEYLDEFIENFNLYENKQQDLIDTIKERGYFNF